MTTTATQPDLGFGELEAELCDTARRFLADQFPTTRLRELVAADHDETTQLIVADAQTSGGLIFGVAPGHTAEVLSKLDATGHRGARIGQVVDGAPALVLR